MHEAPRARRPRGLRIWPRRRAEGGPNDDSGGLRATALLARLGESAKVLSGGQSLIPLMKLRFASPDHLVDIIRQLHLGVTDLCSLGCKETFDREPQNFAALLPRD